MKRLVDRPAGQNLSVVRSNDKPLDVEESLAAVRRHFEGVAFYCVTQLALWLAKPEFDGGSLDMEVDEKMGEQGDKEKRLAGRRSLTMAERLRRSMTGEMAADLLGLLTRAKPLIAKTTPILGEKEVDVVDVLSRFVQERIIVST